MRSTASLLVKFVLWTVVGALAVAGLVAAIAPATKNLGRAADSQPLALPSLQPLSQRTFVYDAAGTEIAQLYSEEDRLLVDLKDVPEKLQAVILATEDRDFFNHKGIDYKGIVRAFVNDVKGGKRQGGSTITQQLVKNTLFENGRDNTVKDKAKEAVWALRLEAQMSKKEILSRYLNTIYFGNGAYGVRTAAERYFGKSLNQLNLPEMALIAGLIASPDSKNPIDHPQAARERRAEVFKALVAVGMITTFDADRYNQYPLPTTVTRRASYRPNCLSSPIPECGFFVKALQDWLTDDTNPSPAAKALGANKEQRTFRLYHGGLKIYTTWDPTLQAKMDEAGVSQDLCTHNCEDGIKHVSVAMTAIDNRDGSVKAMYSGGNGFEVKNQFNLAIDGKRQPGSQFKAFTLAAAFENGFSPEDRINGGSCSFDKPVSDTYWSPSTDRSGVMSLRTALTHSVNCAFGRLTFALGNCNDNCGTQGAGPRQIVDMAHRLGVKGTLKPVSSITLGVGEVNTLDMASAYSTFPTDGIRRPPLFASKILDSEGSVVFDAKRVVGTRVLDTEVARTMVDVLQGPIKGGTATRAQLDKNRPAAGKTGTTNNNVDAWFTGFTPELTTSVWIGQVKCGNPDDPTCWLSHYVSSSDAQGGRIPAKIWKAFMDAALADTPPTDFVAPDKTLWPRTEYVTEAGRPISKPRIYIPPGATSSTTATPTSGTKAGAKAGAKKPKPKPKPGTPPSTKKP